MSYTAKRAEVTPQSVRSLTEWRDSRGPGEELRDAVEEILRTVERGEDVTVTSETYNGWSNRETWAVGLHLGNEQGLYNETRQRLARAYIAARDEHPEDDWQTYRVGRAGDALREWVSDELLSFDYWREEYGSHPEGLNPMPRDFQMMLTDVGSLWRVDWFEIAASWLSDIDVDEVAAEE